MKIAIHQSDNSFSDQWIEYCKENNIKYKVVNCYDNDIINQLNDCNALMWHHHQSNYKDILIAKQILYALYHTGFVVFPNFYTNWHFDDKIGQKYLLESINAPLVPSYVFYEKKTALNWAKNTHYPKVFKLRGGAGSSNVLLVRSKSEAFKIIKKSFNKGFSYFNKLRYFKEKLNKYLSGNDSIIGVLKGIGRLFIPIKNMNFLNKEKGYAYFQEFIPNNNFDIRVIVIGSKAFAIKRLVRPNDFRASGSGLIIYNKEEIDIRCIKISFDVNKYIKSQCIAFDYVFDNLNNPLILEISYGFSSAGYFKCPGYWDSNLIWHEEKFNPYSWMINELQKTIYA